MFEVKLIQKATFYYEGVQKKLFLTLSSSEYLRLVDKMFTGEDYLVENYLEQASFSLLNSCLYESMIKKCSGELQRAALMSLLAK